MIEYLVLVGLVGLGYIGLRIIYHYLIKKPPIKPKRKYKKKVVKVVKKEKRKVKKKKISKWERREKERQLRIGVSVKPIVKREEYSDRRGYRRYKDSKRLVHREVAYFMIYLLSWGKYPLMFREYVVHHIDENRKNNKMENLMILTKEEHNKIHRK